METAQREDPDGIFMPPLLRAVAAGGVGKEAEATRGRPGCAARLACFCERDADCGVGHYCTRGHLDASYRVCKKRFGAVG